MFINDVVHLVGLSRKSIRYYESVGLLSPKRSLTNDYRVYSEEDVQTLKRIKVLRELDVPIKDIKSFQEGKISLQECMTDRIHKIEEEINKYNEILNVCHKLSSSNFTFSNMDSSSEFLTIRKLNKEGFTMRTVHESHKKKILGAFLSSMFFEAFLIFLFIMVSYLQFSEEDKMPWGVYYVFAIFFLIPIITIGVNFIKRLREIKGGEEDEASKY